MIRLLKNLLLINNLIILKSYKHHLFVAFFINSYSCQGQQIANYVNNGGFESAKPWNTQKPLFWDAIDTNKFLGILASATISPFLVPYSSFTYQWPRNGANYFGTAMLFKPNSPDELRGYPRNVLKQTLNAGSVYCIKFYCNATNQTPYAIDALGAYFGGINTDTISQCDKPITYLSPQIEYSSGFITDTLNWIPVTGTFVANGTEKYMIIGNFKSNIATNTMIINPSNTIVVSADLLFDDVSCIDIDLPAYAGSDAWILPGDSAFIGRQPDVGIDEACMWYKMPNTTTAIDTVAGLWVKPSVTTSYLVRQEICGNVKWDLVTVYISATGQLDIEQLTQNLKVFPQPAQNEINLKFEIKNPDEFTEVEIFNNLGERVKHQTIEFNNKQSSIKTEDLSEGVYFLSLKNHNGIIIKKRFVIVR
ncbi:MAG: T9SS type A sorting domain-containing protein [Sphingobacteriaceae bacterium]